MHTLVEMATIGGARALHMEDITGSLEPGKRADIVIVSTVMVNGRILMEDRVIPHLNLEEIRGKVLELSGGIRKIVRGLQPAPDSS